MALAPNSSTKSILPLSAYFICRFKEMFRRRNPIHQLVSPYIVPVIAFAPFVMMVVVMLVAVRFWDRRGRWRRPRCWRRNRSGRRRRLRGWCWDGCRRRNRLRIKRAERIVRCNVCGLCGSQEQRPRRCRRARDMIGMQRHSRWSPGSGLSGLCYQRN